MFKSGQLLPLINVKSFRWFVRIAASITLAVLVILRMERFWLPVLLLGMSTSFFWGRWYCGWVCPMQCVAGCSRLVCKAGKNTDKQFPMARVIRSKWLSIPWMTVLFAIFTVCLITGLRVRLFVWISVLGCMFGLFFPVGSWCAALCPWGRVMKLSARLFARKRK